MVSQAIMPRNLTELKSGRDNSYGYAVPHAEKWGDASPSCPPPIDARELVMLYVWSIDRTAKPTPSWH